MQDFKVLILGGTAEARALSAALVQLGGFEVTVSLRGVTKEPQTYAGKMRTGGFGGEAGFRKYLAGARFDACVNATHPFAATMSRNSRLAAETSGIPFLRLARPAWSSQPGDVWHQVASIDEATQAIANHDVVFLALGAQGSRSFADLPAVRFVIRTADPVAPENRWPNARYLTGLPNHDPELEAGLFRAHHVSLLIARNSGGEGGYAKVAAARMLGVPIVMITAPEELPGSSTDSVSGAIRWLKTIT